MRCLVSDEENPQTLLVCKADKNPTVVPYPKSVIYQWSTNPPIQHSWVLEFSSLSSSWYNSRHEKNICYQQFCWCRHRPNDRGWKGPQLESTGKFHIHPLNLNQQSNHPTVSNFGGKHGGCFLNRFLTISYLRVHDIGSVRPGVEEAPNCVGVAGEWQVSQEKWMGRRVMTWGCGCGEDINLSIRKPFNSEPLFLRTQILHHTASFILPLGPVILHGRKAFVPIRRRFSELY